MRIVSLLPSATEIVCALGAQDQLVGRSHECDFPRGVEELPICTAPKFPLSPDSKVIDTSVSNLVKEGLAVYKVNTNKLAVLRPDVVITQSQCEVCAVSYTDVEQAVEICLGGSVNLVDLTPIGYEDIWEDILKVGKAIEKNAEAETLVSDCKSRIDKLANKTYNLAPKRVATIEWIDPLMYAANWVPDLIELAGGTNLLGAKNGHSHYMKWEELLAVNPDVIVLMPCGFDIARTLSEIQTITDKPEWNLLEAVQKGEVYIVDGNQYMNRPGPRVVDAVEILAEIFHPEQFSSHYVGSGWIRYEKVKQHK